MTERRRVQRDQVSKPVFIRAQVVCEDQVNLPCTLLDISDLGARIMIEKPGELPERFTLIMTARGVPRRRCRIVWRGHNEIGVSFETEPKGDDRELEPGSTLDDALDVFALRPGGKPPSR
jgi:hypothetical protein